MTWLLLASALSLASFDWSGGGGSTRFWTVTFAAFSAGALAVWAISAGQIPVPGELVSQVPYPVIVFALSVTGSALLGAGAVARRLPPFSFLAIALSDTALIAALWAHYKSSSSWTLPAVSSWGAGADLAALAALLRLGAAVGAPDRDDAVPRRVRRGGESGPPIDGVMLSVGWWQGAVLAWWAGTAASGVLALGGLLIWAAYARFSKSSLSSLSLAGGLVGLAAASGAQPLALAAAGLAGVSLCLGQRVVSVWALALLPLSLMTQGQFAPTFSGWAQAQQALPSAPGSGLSLLHLVWVVAFPAVWAGAAWRLGALGSDALKAPLTSGALLATAGALAAGLVLLEAPAIGWFAVGCLAAALVVGALFARPRQAADIVSGTEDEAPETQTEPSTGVGQWPGRRRLLAAGWTILVVAAGFGAALALTGAATGFL